MLLALERAAHATATVVLATNESYRAIACGRNRCAATKVFVVRTGPRREDIPQTAAALAPLAGQPRIGYVGVMARQDGVDGLLRSFQRLRETPAGANAQLLLLGDGPERVALEAQARQLGLASAVTFCGFVPRAEVQRVLLTCVMGVTPDPPCPMNNASTMLKALDYMACGLPQVMYDLPENRASAGPAALYAAAGDEADFTAGMARLLGDAALRGTLGAVARERIMHLTWETTAEPALRAAYQRCG